jgi:S-adenosylmethionine hydrolase
MQIITLTTDWNNSDYYSGIIKAYLITSLSDFQVVDITHSIPVFDYKKACFVVKSVYKYFPANTVHIIGVRGVKNKIPAPPIALRHNDQWFFGYHNGAFTQTFDNDNNLEYWYLPCSGNSTFPEFEYLVKPAVKIINGLDIKELGTELQVYTNININMPVYTENGITGVVEYIDGYGNAITNIDREDFDRIGQGRRFQIFVSKMNNMISKINKSYDEENSELIAIFNVLDRLEIVQMNYKANLSLGITVDSPVYIKFQ